jgi:hypothetical protein
VYACGWGADGQTGLGSYKNQSIPKLVEGDIKGERIVKVSSSADAVLALNGKLFYQHFTEIFLIKFELFCIFQKIKATCLVGVTRSMRNLVWPRMICN